MLRGIKRGGLWVAWPLEGFAESTNSPLQIVVLRLASVPNGRNICGCAANIPFATLTARISVNCTSMQRNVAISSSWCDLIGDTIGYLNGKRLPFNSCLTMHLLMRNLPIRCWYRGRNQRSNADRSRKIGQPSIDLRLPVLLPGV